jgi:RNA polymerase sigma-70 factor (ECF subfamily)
VGPADDYADRYRQYLPRILNYIRLRVDGEDLAQDLAATALERAISRQHTLRRPEAFGAWLFSIARNTIAEHYRKRRPLAPLDWVLDQPAPGPPLPERVIRSEELEQLRRALATLPEREQEIIRLKFGGGLGNQEIAQVIHLRAGHVAVLLYRALRKLRVCLGEEQVGTGHDRNR